MIIVIALLLSVGAIARHTFHGSAGTVAILSAAFAAALLSGCRRMHALLYGTFFVGLCLAGALAAKHAEQSMMPRRSIGYREVVLVVQSVNRRLLDTVVAGIDGSFGGSLQVTIPSGVLVLPGDMLRVAGMVTLPQDFTTPNGRVFPYQKFLQGRGIAGVVKNPRIISVSYPQSVSRIASLLQFGQYGIVRISTVARNGIAWIFARYIRFPVDGIVAGMVVGYQGGIPPDIQDLFRVTGVLHVLVLSGYNITLLAGALGAMLRFMPSRIRGIVIAVAVIAIVLISGAGVAAVRAGIMAMVALFATMNVKSYQPLPALVLAYCVCLLVSPEQVFSDPGFHLSFLATYFMILFLPACQRWLSFIPQTKIVDLQELLVLAICSPLFMLPYTMYFSGMTPLASPFANILFAIITPPLMLAGVALLVVSWMPPIAAFAGIAISFFGEAILVILRWCNHLPQLQTPQLPWWGVVLFYAVATIALHRVAIVQFVRQLTGQLAMR